MNWNTKPWWRNIQPAHINDIVIIEKSWEEIQRTVTKLILIWKVVGLIINNIMVEQGEGYQNKLCVRDNTFKQVQEFKELGTILNSQHAWRYKYHNGCCWSMLLCDKNLFKSKRLLRGKKRATISNSYMSPVNTYACATWAKTRSDEEKLCVLESKVLRKIYGPVFNNMEQKGEIRTKAQLYQLYKIEDLIQFFRGTREGHVWRPIEVYWKKQWQIFGGKGIETKGKTTEKKER